MLEVHDVPIEGAKLIATQSKWDARGSFSRLFCRNTLAGLLGDRQILHINQSQTTTVGAIRGLHYQVHPFCEIKLVRCIRGRVWDVCVDLRKESATFLKWFGAELNPDNKDMLLIPEGCAHGFQVLEPNSEMLYLHTQVYNADFEAGIRYDDPRIGITWPLEARDLSNRDANHPYITESFGPEF